MNLQEQMDQIKGRIYKEDISFLKKYIGYNKKEYITLFLLSKYETKNYSYKAFLDLFKEDFYKDSFFDFSNFKDRLYRHIDKGTYHKFLEDFIVQEKTGESQYFYVHLCTFCTYFDYDENDDPVISSKERKFSDVYSTEENRGNKRLITPQEHTELRKAEEYKESEGYVVERSYYRTKIKYPRIKQVEDTND